jgi:hypothetical protein
MSDRDEVGRELTASLTAEVNIDVVIHGRSPSEGRLTGIATLYKVTRDRVVVHATAAIVAWQ